VEESKATRREKKTQDSCLTTHGSRRTAQGRNIKVNRLITYDTMKKFINRTTHDTRYNFTDFDLIPKILKFDLE
jgi:hypothetical protein